jgi:hypothetical protein
MNAAQAVLTGLLAGGFALIVGAQALPPSELKDPKLRALQEKHQADLGAISAEIQAHSYPAKFYLSRTLDLGARAAASADARSIEFGAFDKQTVLLVRGNYTAIYPSTTPLEDRIKRTYLDVAVPIVKATIPRVLGSGEPETTAIVIELSHHIRKSSVMTIDRFENATITLSRATAQKVAGSNDPALQLAALTEANISVDGRPLRLNGKVDAPAAVTDSQISPARPETPIAVGVAPSVERTARSQAAPVQKTDLHTSTLQTGDLQTGIEAMLKSLAEQAHFDPAAKPEVTRFRDAFYLRISVITSLPPDAAGSQYRLAALAFDRHVSHLIRPALPYFKSTTGLDGIAFRATVSAGENSRSEVVEFFFPLTELQRYDRYDITGQQLINAGFVLINGERVGLDLQAAEGAKP